MLLHFKVIMLGDQSVGKTALVHRFVKNTFGGKFLPTLGIDISLKELKIDNKTDVKIQIWDIGGQEQYKKFRARYFLNAKGVIFVYDVTKEKSLESLGRWLQELNASGVKDIPFILLGNKMDLVTDKIDEVKAAELPILIQDEIKKQMGAGWYGTSAKTGHNVLNAFVQLTKAIIISGNLGEIESEGEQDPIVSAPWQLNY